MFGSYFKSGKFITQAKAYAGELSKKGILLELTGKNGDSFLFPTSHFKSARFALLKAGLRYEEIEKLVKFLATVQRLDGIPSGKLQLLNAMRQFSTATSDLRKVSEAHLESLARDAVLHHIDIPVERRIGEKYVAMQNVLTQTDDISVRELARLIVHTIQENWHGGNPNILLVERDKEGREFLIPTEIALPEFVIEFGQKLRGKRLGEHKIPVSRDSNNLYVQAFQKGDIVFEINITADTFKKVAEDFIDTKIEMGGKYWDLFKTVTFPEKNSLIMVPLIYRGNKLGIVAMLKNGFFSLQERREIDFFLTLATFVLVRKQIEEQLKIMQSTLLQKERMAAMGEMAAITSHAFKNILMGSAGLSEEQYLLAKRILALADIISTKATLGMPTEKNLELLSEMSAKMLDQVASNQAVLEDAQRTVRGMLSFATVGSGEKRIISLKSYMTDKLKHYQLRAKGKGITFRIDLSGIDDTDGLYIVESELGSLLLNLISNAIEAFDGIGSRSGGDKCINISTKRDSKDNILILVEDNGCGIHSNKLPSLFVSSGRSTKPGGTGLGMITIKQIVDGNGGEINVKSLVRQGTTFTIRFPRKEILTAKEHVERTITHKHVISPTKAQNTKVMLVEDNKELREQTKRILKEMGFSFVDDFPNAEEALAALKEDRVSPNLIISDQAMLAMNGLEFFSNVSVLYREKSMRRPQLAIYSGDIKPSDANPIAKTVSDFGISWIEKGSDLKAFRSSVARIVLSDGKDEGGTLPGGYLQTLHSGNPFLTFVGRLVHKINNLITLPSALLALYSEGNKPQDLKNAIKEFVKLNKVFEGLMDFADSAKDTDFEKQSFKQCLLPGAIKKDKIVEEIWASLPPGQKYKLAILCSFFIKGITKHINILIHIFKKNILNDGEIKMAAQALDSISKWKNAVMLVSETEEDAHRFSLYYELLEKD